MSNYEQVELDEKGFPVLRDKEDHFLSLANARFNKSQSSVAGTTRQTSSGNPWFDPSSGRFANGPAGVTIKGGGALLRNLLNSSRALISQRISIIGADGMAATPGEDGRITILLYKGDLVVARFAVPTKSVAVDKINDPEAENEPLLPSSMPEGVNPEEWARRMDAIRDAAREFDDVGLEDLREWLKGRTTRDLEENELEEFLKDIRRQRLSDLLDVLENSIRRAMPLRGRNRRTVRVAAPRGWSRRTLTGLNDDEVAELFRRLESRGFTSDELDSHLLKRFPDIRRDKLRALVGASDESRKTKSGSSANSR